MAYVNKLYLCIMKTYNNIAIVCGDGRKSGKTTLCCRLIEKYQHKGVIAIKICPHFHPVDGMEVINEVPGAYGIYAEKTPGTGKDSSLMLDAGAALVLYVQCKGIEIIKAWKEIAPLLPDDRPVVIESGGLSRIIQPGLSLLVKGSPQQKPAEKCMAELTLFPHVEKAVASIRFLRGKWSYKR